MFRDLKAKAVDFRGRAAKARQSAKTATTPENRKDFLLIADSYEQLAISLDNLDRIRAEIADSLGVAQSVPR
jgi:hypothetical protein